MSVTVPQVPMLTGAALTARARELNIPGRSKMTAAQLRAAIAARCPVTGAESCADRQCELHYMSAPLRLAPVPFRTRNGKHKRSITRPRPRHNWR